MNRRQYQYFILQEQKPQSIIIEEKLIKSEKSQSNQGREIKSEIKKGDKSEIKAEKRNQITHRNIE